MKIIALVQPSGTGLEFQHQEAEIRGLAGQHQLGLRKTMSQAKYKVLTLFILLPVWLLHKSQNFCVPLEEGLEFSPSARVTVWLSLIPPPFLLLRKLVAYRMLLQL